MTDSDRSFVDVHLHADGVAEIRLARPERRNALGVVVLNALREALDEVNSAGSRAVVLSAEGSVFSAGADFADLTGTSSDVEYDSHVQGIADAIAASRAPVIAAVDGPCLGASVDVVSACDLVVASSAARFEVPAARLGILYNPSSVARMHRTLPRNFVRLLFMGISVPAADAFALGALARLVEEDARAESLKIAAVVSASQPDAMSAIRSLLRLLDADKVAEVSSFQAVRRELLDSPGRSAALAQARNTVGDKS